MASTLHLIVLNFFLSLIPIVEAKFAIPFTISRGLHPALAFLSSLLAGIFGAIILFLFLDFIHARLLKYSFYKRSFNYAIVLIRKKEARIKDKMNITLAELKYLMKMVLSMTGTRQEKNSR